jgi:hypothetical protein
MHTRIILAAVLALAPMTVGAATHSAWAQSWTHQQVAPGYETWRGTDSRGDWWGTTQQFQNGTRFDRIFGPTPGQTSYCTTNRIGDSVVTQCF